MKTRLLVLLLAALRLTLPSTGAEPGQILIAVARLLEQGHYTKAKLDGAKSQLALTIYLEALDPNHLQFTQEDIKKVSASYGTTLDNDILLGNPQPVFAIYDLYKKRVAQRTSFEKQLLASKSGGKGPELQPINRDFTGNLTVEYKREKAPWPENERAAEQLWIARLENELLEAGLNRQEEAEAVDMLRKRCERFLRAVDEASQEQVLKVFLNALASSYDSQSEYLTASDLKEFADAAQLKEVGIGLVLRARDSYSEILEIIPGGVAERDGRLKVGDRISAVAEAKGEFVDCAEMELGKVVKLIRGKKGTPIRLRVIPANALDPSERREIELIRNDTEQPRARGEVIVRTMPGAATLSFGRIVLPSFYSDMSNSGAATAAKDVAKLIDELKQENVRGLVLDMRNNGGGSLEESINLCSLFIGKGPVLQARDSNGAIHLSRARAPSAAWDGPLVVLTNRRTAGAGEIVAAALQDYSRAVIIGDSRTWGMGCVATMLEIGRIMPFLGSDSSAAGALKLTIQKFYRVTGAGIQLKGVVPDVRLPSDLDREDIGQDSKKNSLPYDSVEAVAFDRWKQPIPIADLQRRSSVRVQASPEFSNIISDLDLRAKRLAQNRLPVNEKRRRAELNQNRLRQQERDAERKARLASGLSFDIRPLTSSADESTRANRTSSAVPPLIDPVLEETVYIISDMVDLARIAPPPKAR